MAEPIQIEVTASDPVETPVIVTPPAAPVAPPPQPAAPPEPPPYDPQRLEKDIAFYQRTGADKVVLEKLGAVSRSEFEALKLDNAVEKAINAYGLRADDAALIRGNTVEEVHQKAALLKQRYEGLGAVNQPPPPPEIKLPERQYTPQEATLARAQYDLKHDPEIQKFKRDNNIA